MTIQPTVGRIVHYWRQGHEGRIAFAAMILAVHSDDDVSLLVFECPPLQPGQCVPCNTLHYGSGFAYIRTTRAEMPTIARWTWPERV